MIYKNPIIKILIVIFCIVFFPLTISASDLELNLNYPIIGNIVLGNFGISEVATWLYYMIIIVATIAAFGVIVWGGVEYMTSMGNPSKMKSSVNRIQDAVIGLLLVLVAWLTINTINPEILNFNDPTLKPIGIGGSENIFIPSFSNIKYEDRFLNSSSDFVGRIDSDDVRIVPWASDDPKTPWGCPVEGVISSPYGWRSDGFHRGIDIAKRDCSKNNYPIRSTADGIVTRAGTGSGYGYLIVINHGNYHTLYAHLKTFSLVKVGQKISAGELISYMGGKPGMPGAGSTSGCHLHYEVHKNGFAYSSKYTQNPRKYFEVKNNNCYF